MSPAGDGDPASGGETPRRREIGELPEAALRLFPDLVAPEAGSTLDAGGPPDPEAHAPFVIGRLLEDGDGEDLRWLVRRYGEERLAAWLCRRGGRRLSRRSRRFWELVLDREAGPEAPAAGEIWPL